MVDWWFTYLLHHLDATDAELAAAVGTTEKQVKRVSALTAARIAIRRYREGKPTREPFRP
ncbi:MAG: hypothetical protein KJZ78_24890 [Bryobacteraceae bacterium]|nr:hypothetical protein [Bryobacteraceae bacterium]